VVVEDAPDGIAAAHAAGCRCIAVTNSARREKLETADRIVSTLTEIGLQAVMDLIEQGD
jgi:beta-phosphoglucomutase-like phosphatase (HAD superfamily)